MTLNRVKPGRAVTFIASLVSLVFLPKILIWNKITLWLSTEPVVNELTKSISKNLTNIPFSIRFITLIVKISRTYNERTR